MYLDFESENEFANAVAGFDSEPGRHVMILLSETHQRQLETIVGALDRAGVRFFGGVFPGLIVGRELKTRGAVLKSVKLLDSPRIVDLSQAGQLQESVAGMPEVADDKPTLHVFLEALSPHIGSFLDRLFDNYGNRYNFFGAGCGNRNLEQLPAVFDNSGAYVQSAVLALVDRRGEVGVAHGLQRIKGPFVATRTEGNVIQELNWDNAFKVYIEALPPEYRDVPREQFWERVSQQFPVGLHKENSEDIIRDPLNVTPEGGLVCMSEVPVNSVLYISDSQADRMVAAAGAVIAEVAGRCDAVEDCLVCDCLARNLYLGDDYRNELDAISDGLAAAAPRLTAEGALVLGEIAGDGERALELHNKTFVVSVSRG